MLATLKDYDIPIIIYLSKADILPKDKIDKAKRKYKAVAGFEILKSKIEKSLSEHYFEN